MLSWQNLSRLHVQRSVSRGGYGTLRWLRAVNQVQTLTSEEKAMSSIPTLCFLVALFAVGMLHARDLDTHRCFLTSLFIRIPLLLVGHRWEF